jgi:hypothetical protein
MHIRNIPHRWLCALILCCAATALGQSMNSSVGGALNESSATTVSGFVNASALTSPTAAGGSRSNSAPAMSHLQPGMVLTRGSGRLRVGKLSGNLPNVKAGTTNVSHSETGNPAGAHPSLGGIGGGSYSEDFPDSTEGTALISPPERGASSPLDWTPGFNFEFPDMSEEKFLNPTLHVGGRKIYRLGLRNNTRIGLANSGKLPTVHDLFSLPTASLNQTFKSQTLPKSILDPSSSLQP